MVRWVSNVAGTKVGIKGREREGIKDEGENLNNSINI